MRPAESIKYFIISKVEAGKSNWAGIENRQLADSTTALIGAIA
jgi:hypothetical protein